jgi:lincosamide nucleotidyltransferase A/C/D/E
MPDDTVMTATEVLAIITDLADGEIGAWVAGGWAIDALVGEETRPHRDPDLAVRSDQPPFGIDLA